MMEAYKKLWNRRGEAERVTTQEEMEALIEKELNDELTHPRLRQTREEKLSLAFDRINKSDLTEIEKAGLSDTYRRVADRMGQ